jgi:hypothetical protein
MHLVGFIIKKFNGLFKSFIRRVTAIWQANPSDELKKTQTIWKEAVQARCKTLNQ